MLQRDIDITQQERSNAMSDTLVAIKDSFYVGDCRFSGETGNYQLKKNNQIISIHETFDEALESFHKLIRG